MAVAIPYLMLAGAAVAAYGAVRQGQYAKAAADFNATVSRQNAQVSRQNAADQAHQQDRETYLRLGAIKANQGKSGGTNEGSVLDVIGDVAAQSELEKQYTFYQGELQARGFNNTASLDTASGQAAEQQGKMAAGSELLKGAGNAYYANSQLKRT